MKNVRRVIFVLLLSMMLVTPLFVTGCINIGGGGDEGGEDTEARSRTVLVTRYELEAQADWSFAQIVAHHDSDAPRLTLRLQEANVWRASLPPLYVRAINDSLGEVSHAAVESSINMDSNSRVHFSQSTMEFSLWGSPSNNPEFDEVVTIRASGLALRVRIIRSPIMEGVFISHFHSGIILVTHASPAVYRMAERFRVYVDGEYWRTLGTERPYNEILVSDFANEHGVGIYELTGVAEADGLDDVAKSNTLVIYVDQFAPPVFGITPAAVTWDAGQFGSTHRPQRIWFYADDEPMFGTDTTFASGGRVIPWNQVPTTGTPITARVSEFFRTGATAGDNYLVFYLPSKLSTEIIFERNRLDAPSNIRFERQGTLNAVHLHWDNWAAGTNLPSQNNWSAISSIRLYINGQFAHTLQGILWTPSVSRTMSWNLLDRNGLNVQQTLEPGDTIQLRANSGHTHFDASDLSEALVWRDLFVLSVPDISSATLAGTILSWDAVYGAVEYVVTFHGPTTLFTVIVGEPYIDLDSVSDRFSRDMLDYGFALRVQDCVFGRSVGTVTRPLTDFV